MENLLVIFLCAAIVGAALRYICRQKKKGIKCIGCPDSGACSGSCRSCGCHCHQ